MKRYPIIYLPIEFGAREFDSKALLATILASRGYAVVIGQQWLMYPNFPRLPPGAVLFKSFNSIHHEAMQIAKSAAHRVVTLEEELLSHIDGKLVAMFCVDNLFSLPDAIFANSQFEADILREASKGRVQIEVTGNGRVDILKPKFRAFFQADIDAVRARFGDFVLVNTNFGLTNTNWSSIEEAMKIQVRAGYLKLDDPESLAAWNQQIAFEEVNKASIITAIKELCRRRPNQKVVLRPHPAEALARWDGVFKEFPNVAVVREGAHVPWTLGCQLLLHTSCTTGFEAHAGGKMALSLVPQPNFISQSFLSNQLNPVFADPIQMIDAAEAYLDRGEMPIKPAFTPAQMEYYVANIGEKSGVERIADCLIQDLPPPGGSIPLAPLQQIARQEKLKEKFSLSPQQGADIFQRIFRASGIKQSMNLTPLGDSLFALTSSKPA